MVQVSCPTCNKPFDSQASSAMPFCSDRCRRIDLNRWLKEDISLPYRELPEGDQPGNAGRFDDEND